MNRVLKVTRMQLINKQTFVWVPLMVIGGAFAISWLIFAIVFGSIGVAPELGDGFNGATQAPMWYFLVIGVQSLTLTFPFSQALSVSRRTFFLGTTLVAAAAGAVIATFYTLMRPLEVATNGWGVGSNMFNVPWVTDGPWYHGWVFFLAMMLVFFLFGFWAATIYKRWGTVATTAALTGLALVLVGVIALIAWQQWWTAVWTWLGQQTSLSIGLWMLALAVVLSISSYLTLRRAVP